MNPRRFSLLKRCGYSQARWAHGPRWRVRALTGERWFGQTSVPVLPGHPDEVLLVPLPGHSRGHCGVAVRSAGGWLFHCGDAYVQQHLVDPGGARDPLRRWSRSFERHVALVRSLAHLRRLVQEHGNVVDVFCAHDPQAFRKLHGG